MTFGFGIENLGREVLRNKVDEFARRSQVAENSTRQAENNFTYTTHGAGQVIMPQPVTFDCVFVEEPCFTSGMALVKPPDIKHYRYPLVTAGVYRWVQEPQKPKTEDEKMAAAALKFNSDGGAPVVVEDNEPQFYKGAYLYFVVRADPLLNVRSDGSNLAQLQTAYAQADDSQKPGLQALINEAQEALYLTAHPPQMVIHHHLKFTGVAMKKLSDSVLKLADDKKVDPEPGQ